MHPLVRLAKQAVELYVREGSVVTYTGEVSGGMLEKAGVFVCLKKNGRLRGCVGTIQPVTSCAALEAVRNAIAAATEDPRFPPVGPHELEEIDYQVDVLLPPEKITGTSELDPRRYGLIIVKGARKGLLLPDLEGVDSVEEQFRIAMAKAGIDPSERGMDMYRFEVARYS
ncbi:MAG: AmmeMemoRadiSam system protein A [Nitrospiraceae bacterium]|nr:AmmeMemoRadiSam system protein A [Nitrospiraceae bacterium]